MRHNQYITTYASAGSEDSITDLAIKGIVDELRMEEFEFEIGFTANQKSTDEKSQCVTMNNQYGTTSATRCSRVYLCGTSS